MPVLAALLVLIAREGSAAPPSEQSVKAAFLSKFARYVTWPDGSRPAAGAPFQICIVGRDPFGRVADAAVAGQRIDDHPVLVRRAASASAAIGCQVAFVDGGRKGATAAMLTALGTAHVLTVTDERFGSDRGMIHFAMAANRVRFHIDNAVVARSGLSISSRLLELAIDVKG